MSLVAGLPAGSCARREVISKHQARRLLIDGVTTISTSAARHADRQHGTTACCAGVVLRLFVLQLL